MAGTPKNGWIRSPSKACGYLMSGRSCLCRALGFTMALMADLVQGESEAVGTVFAGG